MPLTLDGGLRAVSLGRDPGVHLQGDEGASPGQKGGVRKHRVGVLVPLAPMGHL